MISPRYLVLCWLLMLVLTSCGPQGFSCEDCDKVNIPPPSQGIPSLQFNDDIEMDDTFQSFDVYVPDEERKCLTWTSKEPEVHVWINRKGCEKYLILHPEP